jgi:glycosyltransferase involved in cell wall biosynthesis
LSLPASLPSSSFTAAVSVIIPAFNYAHYLPSAIESVLAQTHTDLELLIIDDGSTDSTADLCASCVDPRLRYIWQKNAGLSAARNTGIREARFSYLAFLDADDRWQPDFLRTVLDRFAQLGSDFSAVGTASIRVTPDGKPISAKGRDLQREGELTAADFCLRNRPFSSSIVLKRSAFENCGSFDTSLRSSEDRDMWIRLCASGHRFYFLHQPLACIRRHPGNMSKNAPRMKRNSGRVLLKAWRTGAVPRWRLDLWLRAASVHYFLVAWTHRDDGLRTHALLYLLTSVAFWPFFLRPRLVFEPPFFRLRALAHFLLPPWRRTA